MKPQRQYKNNIKVKLGVHTVQEGNNKKKTDRVENGS